MSLTLTLIQAPPGRISLGGVTPDRLAPLALSDIERLPLAWGNEHFTLGDFFRVSGTPAEHLVFEGMDRRFVDLCAGMRSGDCEVHGDAGAFLGRDMQGGRLRVRGDAGDFAASGMSGGALRIDGDAGDSLGAALPWQSGGMKGGRVSVLGDVGQRCGDKLRRGEIIVGGSVGEFCGSRMVAGTIAVAGRCGEHAGYSMRRGTLLLRDADFTPAPTFVETAVCATAFLQLLERNWRAVLDDDLPQASWRLSGSSLRRRRWMGDIATTGRGEVLVIQDA